MIDNYISYSIYHTRRLVTSDYIWIIPYKGVRIFSRIFSHSYSNHFVCTLSLSLYAHSFAVHVYRESGERKIAIIDYYYYYYYYYDCYLWSANGERMIVVSLYIFWTWLRKIFALDSYYFVFSHHETILLVCCQYGLVSNLLSIPGYPLLFTKLNKNSWKASRFKIICNTKF